MENYITILFILDDGSVAEQQLVLKGTAESLVLRTVRQDTEVLRGASVNFTISAAISQRKYQVKGAFTAQQLGLPEQFYSYPIPSLLKRFSHLKCLPLETFNKVLPMQLIGADHPYLLTPIEKVRLRPHRGPARVHTRLGWALQGSVQSAQSDETEIQRLFLSGAPISTQLQQDVEWLRHWDVFPYRIKKAIIQSKQDQYALACLDQLTTRETVNGVTRYATPLIWS